MPNDLPAVPLPAFRQPHQHRLDELPPDSQITSPDEPPASPPASPEPSRPDAALPPPIESNPERRAAGRTRTSATDPSAAGKALAGLLVIVAGVAAALLARSGRALRQPTPRQVDDVAAPIGRIIARHLPTDLIGPDLADVTEAAAAAHAYVLDPAGPLIARSAPAPVDYPEQEI